MGTGGHCWYQSSSSLWSPVEGRKSTLGHFVNHHNCRLKKMHNLRVGVKFHLGQNEDCSPGGSISDSSERLLPK